MWKQMMALFLLFGCFFTVAAPTGSAAQPFADVSSTYRAYEEIMYLAEGKIVSGNKGLYEPNRNVTRAEAAVMLGRALGLDGSKKKTAFKDVSSTSFASGYIQSAANKGIINGFTNGTFQPNKPVTRGEMALFISRAFGYGNKLTMDGAAAKLMEQGISQGMKNGDFAVERNITRADYAVFLARAINYKLRLKPHLAAMDVLSVKANGGLNVRTGPSTSYQIKGALNNGTKVSEAYRVGNWIYVKAPTIEGFVSGQYVAKAMQESEKSEEKQGKDGTVQKPNESNGPSAGTEKPNENNGSSAGTERPNGSNGPSTGTEKPTGNNGTSTEKENPNEENGTSAGKDKANEENTPPGNKTSIESQVIVIDAGHGGKDVGADGFGLFEKNINLDTALKVQELFAKTPFNIVMTREGDTYPTLSERVEIAKKVKGNVFVSIHSNAFNGSANGIETYFYSASFNPYVTDSEMLATAIQNRLVAIGKTNNRGVKPGNLHVLRENNMPAALVELGFIDHAGDNAKLKSEEWRQAAAQAIYWGILDYYKQKGFNVSELY